MKNKFSVYIDNLQSTITNHIENLDGKSKFEKDNWNREKGGGGLTMVLENGNVFEKAGVNVSKVYGELPESMSKLLNTNQSSFFACGISIVFHPKNPMVPTFHANLRSSNFRAPKSAFQSPLRYTNCLELLIGFVLLKVFYL